MERGLSSGLQPARPTKEPGEARLVRGKWQQPKSESLAVPPLALRVPGLGEGVSIQDRSNIAGRVVREWIRGEKAECVCVVVEKQVCDRISAEKGHDSGHGVGHRLLRAAGARPCGGGFGAADERAGKDFPPDCIVETGQRRHDRQPIEEGEIPAQDQRALKKRKIARNPVSSNCTSHP